MLGDSKAVLTRHLPLLQLEPQEWCLVVREELQTQQDLFRDNLQGEQQDQLCLIVCMLNLREISAKKEVQECNEEVK